MTDLPWIAAGARLVLMSGFCLVLGIMVIEAFLPVQNGPSHGRELRIFVLGLALMLLASITEVCSMAWSLGDGNFVQAIALIQAMFGTFKGTCVVMAARGALVVWLLAWRVGFEQKFGVPTAVTFGFALAGTLASDGHGADAGIPSLLFGIDAIHALSAGAWLGGLALLWRLVPRHDNPLASVQAFSRLATICFPLALVSGVANAWLHLAGHGGLVALSRPGYGWTLVGKSVLVFTVLCLAAVIRQLRLPAWEKAGGPGDGIRRHLTVELAGGILILVATAWLTQLPSPMEAPSAHSSEIGFYRILGDHDDPGARSPWRSPEGAPRRGDSPGDNRPPGGARSPG